MLLTVDYPGEIDLLRFNAEGTRLALAQNWRQESGGEVLVVVEVPSGKEVARFTGLHGVQDMVFRSEAELFVFHGFECWLCGPKKRTRRILGKDDLQDARGPVNTGALGPDGKTLAVGASGLLLVDTARQRIRTSIPTPTSGSVSATAFSPDGRYLAIGSRSSEWPQISFVLIWDVPRVKRVGLVKLDADGIDALAFRPDNRQLAIVKGRGGTCVELFDMDTPQLCPGDLDRLCARTYSSVFDLFFGTAWTVPAAALSPEAGMIGSLRFSPTGRILKVAGYGGKAVRLYSRSGRVLSRARAPDGYQAMATAVSSQGMAASVVGDSRSIL
jgi:WD40 repeat protein